MEPGMKLPFTYNAEHQLASITYPSGVRFTTWIASEQLARKWYRDKVRAKTKANRGKRRDD